MKHNVHVKYVLQYIFMNRFTYTVKMYMSKLVCSMKSFGCLEISLQCQEFCSHAPPWASQDLSGETGNTMVIGIFIVIASSCLLCNNSTKTTAISSSKSSSNSSSSNEDNNITRKTRTRPLHAGHCASCGCRACNMADVCYKGCRFQASKSHWHTEQNTDVERHRRN